jgi:voltage-gated potassium channel
MLNVEPELFEGFLDSVYWATVSLTTIGYGDIVPDSDIGKIVVLISSFLGIAVIALPAGIITAGYMEEVQEHKRTLRLRRRKNVDDKHDFHHRD